MLASSFLDWRAINLNAPGKAAGTFIEGALLVEVRADGLRLGGNPIRLVTLIAQIRSRLDRKPDQKVAVRPAAGVVLQDTVTVLDALSAAGVRDLTLVRKR